MARPSDQLFDRLPPHSLDAEKGVIGCVLLDWKQCLSLSIDRGITSESFYDIKHQLIWSAFLKLESEGVAIDPITLFERVKTDKVLDNAGGLSYISSVADVVPSAASIVHYLDIVVDLYKKRQMIRVAWSIEDMARNDSAPASESLDKAEGMLMAIDQENAVLNETVIARDVARGVIDDTQAAFDTGGKAQGLLTGISDLDKAITTGMCKGEVFYLAGRPSMGKSSLAMQIALFVAENSIPVGVFSLEMTSRAIGSRCISHFSRVNLTNILTGRLSEQELRAFGTASKRFGELPIYFDDRAGISMAQIRARARRMVATWNVGFIVVDYLQLIRTDRQLGEYERISEVSVGIKILARQLNIPILCLVQLNREIDKDKPRKPRLSDLRGSGGLEQDGDIIAALWNDQSERDSQAADIVPTTVSLLKQRNGRLADVPLVFMKHIMRHELRSV